MTRTRDLIIFNMWLIGSFLSTVPTDRAFMLLIAILHLFAIVISEFARQIRLRKKIQDLDHKISQWEKMKEDLENVK